jgi:cellulose biosynthesis protein BcsQ
VRQDGGLLLARDVEVVAVVNQKGGGGQDDDAVNIGRAWRLGRCVLLIDLDLRACTSGVGVDRRSLELSYMIV